MAKKILRWFLSNLLTILVIISVIYCYIYWGNLTGENTPASKAVAFLSKKFDGVDEFVEGVKTKQARLAGGQPGQLSVAQSDATAPDDASNINTQTSETEIPTSMHSSDSQDSVSQENVSQEGESQEDVLTENKQPDVAEDVVVNEQQAIANVNELTQNNTALSESDTSNTDVDVASENVAENKEEHLSQQQAEVSGTESSTSEQVNEATENVSNDEAEQQSTSISFSQNNTQITQNANNKIDSLSQQQPVVEKTEEISSSASSFDESAKTAFTSDVKSKDDFISPEVAEKIESAQQESTPGESVSEQIASVPETSTPTPTAVNNGDMSIQDTWVLARSAFYQKKYALSEQSYLSVIAATKDNFDAYGELGNVYFSQGKKTQAADAYLQSATILFTKGHTQRAQSLLRVLQELDMSKANQLKYLMDASSL